MTKAKDTSSAHTPGAWTVEDSETEELYIQPEVAMIYSDNEAKEADAHLIAAAPELLEACERSLSLLEQEQESWGQKDGEGGMFEAPIELCKAAISKAKGK